MGQRVTQPLLSSSGSNQPREEKRASSASDDASQVASEASREVQFRLSVFLCLCEHLHHVDRDSKTSSAAASSAVDPPATERRRLLPEDTSDRKAALRDIPIAGGLSRTSSSVETRELLKGEEMLNLAIASVVDYFFAPRQGLMSAVLEVTSACGCELMINKFAVLFVALLLSPLLLAVYWALQLIFNLAYALHHLYSGGCGRLRRGPDTWQLPVLLGFTGDVLSDVLVDGWRGWAKNMAKLSLSCWVAFCLAIGLFPMPTYTSSAADEWGSIVLYVVVAATFAALQAASLDEDVVHIQRALPHASSRRGEIVVKQERLAELVTKLHRPLAIEYSGPRDDNVPERKEKQPQRRFEDGHALMRALTGITDDQRQDPDTFIRKLNFYCCDTLTAFLLAFLYLLHLGDRVVKIMEQRYNLVEFNRHTNNQLLRSLPGIECWRDVRDYIYTLGETVTLMKVNYVIALSALVLLGDCVALFVGAVVGSDVEHNLFFWFTVIDLVVIGFYLLLLVIWCADMHLLQQRDRESMQLVIAEFSREQLAHVERGEPEDPLLEARIKHLHELVYLLSIEDKAPKLLGVTITSGHVALFTTQLLTGAASAVFAVFRKRLTFL